MTAARKLPRVHALPDERALEEMRAKAPRYGNYGWFQRLLRRLPAQRGGDYRFPRLTHEGTCGYCRRKSKTSRIAVNPITLQRSYEQLCGRDECYKQLREWEGSSDARRRRAQFDWERENPDIAPAALIGHIPQQYPSVSRATLRAFLDSGGDAATVQIADGQSLTAASLNGTIRRLGFAGQVFAEIRSGSVVLRRSAIADHEAGR